MGQLLVKNGRKVDGNQNINHLSNVLSKHYRVKIWRAIESYNGPNTIIHTLKDIIKLKSIVSSLVK